MKRGPTGDLRTVSTAGGEEVRAFLPRPLPPDPPLDLDSALRSSMYDAHLALGRLDSVTVLLLDTRLFLYMYVRKEAVLSSQIEGTQSSLSDLLLFEMDEAPGVPMDDVGEVSNYVAAITHGLARLRAGFPLSGRLIREIHEILLGSGRGSTKQPGEFRRSQNWIGGSRPGDAAFVPPPPETVAKCMGQLELWLHDETPGGRTPAVLKAALAHVQFETIHPFLDGNGRVGRLLITLLLCAEQVLAEPLLYLSLYFKQRRSEYYALLDQVRTDGDWEQWLAFFARGVTETAGSAVRTAQRLVERAQSDARAIQGIKRRAGSALRVHRAMQQRPIATAAVLAAVSGVSLPSVNASLVALRGLGIVREMTGRRRNRVFVYDNYLSVLSEGTEPVAG